MTETLISPATYVEVLDHYPDMHPDLRAHTERLALSNGETIARQEVEELGEIADEGAGVVAGFQNGYGEQLSIADELTDPRHWPQTDAQKGLTPNMATVEGTYDLSGMSPQEENAYINQTVKHIKAQEELHAGAIDLAEYTKRVDDIHKAPREYQQPLLRQDGQLFNAAEPLVDDPSVGVGAENGTFWHASNQVMEPGDRLMPSGEVSDSIHAENMQTRPFKSSSAPEGSSFAREQDFAMGTPRDAGYLPEGYGEHMYKVSSPNSTVVQTVNGPEVWAEGGGRIEERMHPDFARNYNVARSRVLNEQDFRQPALQGMENGMQFVPERELNVPAKEFYDKYKSDEGIYPPVANTQQLPPNDVALPGLEQYGERPPAPASPTGARPMM